MSALERLEDDRTQPSEETIRMIATLKILSKERREATRAGDISKLLVINESEKALKKRINSTIKNELWFMNASLYGLKRVSQIYRMMENQERFSQCINIGMSYQRVIQAIEEEIEVFGYEKSGDLI